MDFINLTIGVVSSTLLVFTSRAFYIKGYKSGARRILKEWKEFNYDTDKRG